MRTELDLPVLEAHVSEGRSDNQAQDGGRSFQGKGGGLTREEEAVHPFSGKVAGLGEGELHLPDLRETESSDRRPYLARGGRRKSGASESSNSMWTV